MKTKNQRRGPLSVEKIIREFEESEAKPGHRKDAFKISVSFDQAIRVIAKPGPEPKCRHDIGNQRKKK